MGGDSETQCETHLNRERESAKHIGRQRLWKQVSNKVGHKAGNKVRDKAGTKVRDSAGDTVRDKLGHKVGDKVGDKLGHTLGAKVGNKVGDNVRNKGETKWETILGNKVRGTKWERSW